MQNPGGGLVCVFREVKAGVVGDGGQDLGGVGLGQPSGSNYSGECGFI